MSEASDDDLEDLYQNAPCGLLSVDSRARIIRTNATLCGWLGMTSDQLVGRRLPDLLTVSGRIFYETHFAPLLRMQHILLEIALDFVGADGEKLPVIVNSTERLDPNGEFLWARLAVFKAPERRRYERDLVDARRRAEALNTALEAQIVEARQTAVFREQFIAVLGHDLRNPVAAIDAGANLLLRDGPPARSESILKLMKASVLRITGLIDNVLDLTRARLGDGIHLQREVTKELEATLSQVVQEIQFSHPERVIETQFDVPRPVDVDLPRIAQMLSNLVGNAVTHGSATEPVKVSVENGAGPLSIAVSNGGRPIPQEIAQRLFEPFYRGNGATPSQGLGLGLYIASQIARSHGGELQVRSDAEATVFTFRMPD